MGSKLNEKVLSSAKKKMIPGWALVVIDVLLIGVGLVIFAYFHHVKPRPLTPQTIELPKSTPEPTASQIPEGDGVVTTTPDGGVLADPDEWGIAFTDKFTDGEIIQTDTMYKSANISIDLTEYNEDGVVYFVQDIYIRNKANFMTGFAHDTYGVAYSERPQDIAERVGAVAAINGDYYGAREMGTVIRNGEFYRDVAFRDVCVLYNDGTVRTFSASEFDIETEYPKGIYQAWSFGPMLLDSQGQPMTKFDTDVPRKNPRTVFGYYEPGHYCFIVVDGRDSNYSNGMSMEELSQLVYELGCTAAYNLDGGQTSTMCFNGELVNRPANGGRECSDIIYICEMG